MEWSNEAEGRRTIDIDKEQRGSITDSIYLIEREGFERSLFIVQSMLSQLNLFLPNHLVFLLSIHHHVLVLAHLEGTPDLVPLLREQWAAAGAEQYLKDDLLHLGFSVSLEGIRSIIVNAIDSEMGTTYYRCFVRIWNEIVIAS